jgi:hypothetical protein
MFLADRIGWPGRRESAGATKNPQRSVSNVTRMYSRLQTPLGRGNRT